MSDGTEHSLGKKFLGLFIDTESTPDPTPTAPQRPQGPPAVASGNIRPPVSAGSSIDQEMLAALQKKITARSSPYVTLMEAAQRLATVIPDEPTRLRAAFAMVAGDGNRSVPSITQAIDVHIADLEGERIRFKNASEEQTSSKSTALRNQAASLLAQSAANTSQIERLQEEIKKLQDTLVKNAALTTDLNTQAEAAEASIKAVAMAFDRTVDFVKNDLTAKKLSLSSLLS